MVAGIKKYNPGFLSDDEIVASFCIRKAEFAALLESLHASDGNANAHSLVVGPRGSGKTHLLLRVVAEVRLDARLSGFYPIVFSEESYEVATVGEFWLECLNHLAEQAPEVERAGLRLSYNDLRTTVDDRDLAGRCLGTILDFADRHAKRLVVVVENLNMLFADIADPEAGWRLRHTLQTEPRIVLLGSATSRFDEIDHPNHALYDLFRVLTLQALDTEECGTLWSALSGQPTGSQQIRPLEILTGGNPRLIAVLAGFDKTYSFKDLMANLFDLVDDHTEYFRSHIEALPPQERRVYLALARLWKPATAKEVASQARVNVNKCSAQLGRLVDRGAALIEDGATRRRTYYVAERMYNIYYLLRRPGAESHVVDALVRFMAIYYSPDELVQIGMGMAEGLDRDDPRLQEIQSAALRQLLALPELGGLLVNLLTQDAVIGAFGSLQTPDLVEPMVYALIAKARTMEDEERLEEALGYWEEAIRMADEVGGGDLTIAKGAAVLSKIGLLKKLDRNDEAVRTVAVSYLADDQQVDVDMADEIVRMHLDVDYVAAHPIGIVFRAFTLLTFGKVQAAITETESALRRLEDATDDSDRKVRGIAIIMKGLLAATVGRTIEKTDAETLLSDIREQRLTMLPTQSVHVLLQYISTIEPAEALALIQRAGASDPLQPIVVALRRELGQDPQVSRELDEVSKDVQESIMQMRKGGYTLIRWEELGPQRYEDIVSVLVSRLHPDAQRIDGKGGDGGRDVQIVRGQDNRLTDAFELKSFTGRMTSGRRRQVEQSLKRAAILDPARWSLIVPIDPTPAEDRWFRQLGRIYGFPIAWLGRTWLDEKMSAFPDIRRYFLEGANDEVVGLLRELHQEQARVTVVHDAVARLRTLRERLNEIDPHYRYELSTGPNAADARPADVVLSVSFNDMRVDVYPKYSGAVKDRPITIKVDVIVGPDDSVIQNALDYGLEATIPSRMISSVVVDAPSGLGGSFTGGEIDILSTSRVLEESVTLALEVMDVDRPLASCPVHLTEGTRGSKGSIFSGTDSSGWLQIRLTANAVAGQFEVQFRLDPRPALPSTLVPLFRWLKALQPPHDLKIRWPSGLEMRSKVRTPSPIDEGIGKVVESLAHLQEASGRYWEMSPSLTGEEGQEIVTAATLLRGENIELTWKSFNLNLNRWGPELEDLLNGRPQQFICEQDSWLELEGTTIPIGRIRTHVESARLADPGAIQRALKSGLVPKLRLVPGDSNKAQQVLVSRP